jgi:alanyl-tRNA synthetase
LRSPLFYEDADMNSLEIRKKFLSFFEKNGHQIVSSSSLIPAEDPTLLFTNAGMNQFKDLFLGKAERGYKRATSIQKCVRAGGKHNDLDQVGFTARHLTYFEMMGNFSFGDYFKKEAIQFAWDFLTKEMGLDPDLLHISVFETDDDAYDLWHKTMGVPENRMYRLGEKDNFWQMGDTGPCGPCSEIHYDIGEKHGCGSSDCGPGCDDCSRYMEVWNLVFMQYDRQADGELKPLAKTGVDTGMGFERLCMVMQNKAAVFQTDLFETIHRSIEKLTKIEYEKSNNDTRAAFNVLSDHIRSSCHLIADGCSPSNEGRGYVLRKIIRRAALFSQKLSDNKSIFGDLAQEYIKFMSPIYPELHSSRELIVSVLNSEVEKFATNLLQGRSIFDKYAADLTKKKETVVPGDKVFKLYDTYGFPPELTGLMAQECKLTIDFDGFTKEMKKQKEQSGKKKSGAGKDSFAIPEDITTTFVGNEEYETKSKITFVHQDNDELWISTESSPFYVESGGQVSDVGWVTINEHAYPVKALRKSDGQTNPAIIFQLGYEEKDTDKVAEVKVGLEAHSVVDAHARKSTMKNHTATHLLQAALVQVLGSQVKQAGSLVCPEYLRFDFSHHEAVTPEQISQVEDIVNQKVQDDIEVKKYETTLVEAEAAGVTAFFGEKYNPESVRVVQVPGFSAELCGGVHVSRTGEIGCIKITSEVALATGTRRIVGVTGPEAIKLMQDTFATVKALSEQFKAKPELVLGAVQKQTEQYRKALTEIKQLRKGAWKSQIGTWQNQVVLVNEIPFLYLGLDGVDGGDLKQICQEIEKKSPGFYFVLSKGDERSTFFGYLSKQFAGKIDLKKLGSVLKEKCGLRGGGSPVMIQGGGVDVTSDVNQIVVDWLKS